VPPDGGPDNPRSARAGDLDVARPHDMLPIVPFETHAAAKALTAAGASEKIAVAVVEVAQEAAAEHGRELATRADVARLSVELAATRTDVETVRAGIETVREATRADVAELRAESGPHGNPARQNGWSGPRWSSGRWPSGPAAGCHDDASSAARGRRCGSGRRGPAAAVMTMRLRRTGCAQDRQPV